MSLLNCFTSCVYFWRYMTMGVPTSPINSWVYSPAPSLLYSLFSELEMENQWSLPHQCRITPCSSFSHVWPSLGLSLFLRDDSRSKSVLQWRIVPSSWILPFITCPCYFCICLCSNLACSLPVMCCSKTRYSLAHEAEEALRGFTSTVQRDQLFSDSRVLCVQATTHQHHLGKGRSCRSNFCLCFWERTPE